MAHTWNLNSYCFSSLIIGQPTLYITLYWAANSLYNPLFDNQLFIQPFIGQPNLYSTLCLTTNSLFNPLLASQLFIQPFIGQQTLYSTFFNQPTLYSIFYWPANFLLYYFLKVLIIVYNLA